MSDHEFENYLALLTRLLRLEPKQRDAIAGELRSHLEDRLEDLVSRGMPREQAVRLALEEFGDAAGLAAQFVSISRNKRRRWIMRCTTFSVAALVLIAFGITALLPEGQNGPGAQAVIAQGKKDVEEKKKPKEASKKETTLAAKLDERMDAEFAEAPLEEVLNFIADHSGIQIYVKKKLVAEEAGIALDIPVTKNLKQVRISTLLDLMLSELDLVYVEKDDLLIITTPDDAESTMEVRVYDCRDLLAMAEPGAPRTRGGDFPGMSGGAMPGGADPAGAMPGGGVPGTVVPGPSPYSPPRAAEPPAGTYVPPPPRAAPAAPTPPSPAIGAPAAPAVPAPPSRGQRRSNSEAGLPSPSIPNAVMPQFGGGGLGGGYEVEGMGGGRGGGYMTAQEARAERLMNIITTAVDPHSWAKEMGGPGTISEYNGLIVISQSARTHTKIEKVLEMLREAANLQTPKQGVSRGGGGFF